MTKEKAISLIHQYGKIDPLDDSGWYAFYGTQEKCASFSSSNLTTTLLYLGYIQGVLCALGAFTYAEVAGHNLTGIVK